MTVAGIDLARWAAAQGIIVPTQADAAQAAIAGGLVLAALAIGLTAGRRSGPALGQWWQAHAGGHVNGLAPRAAAITRHGVAALLLAIVAASHLWHPWAGAPLGLALGAAAGLLIHQVLRGLGIPRWASWLVALTLFVALFSRAVGGLQPITATLDLVGFDVGHRRLSLLSLVTLLIVVVGLVALVRLANRMVAHAIGRASTLDPTQKLLGQKLAVIAMVVVAFFIGIDLLGIDLTAFAVFSGAFGLAVGFGLQKTIGNLIAGIILLMDRSIKPGDVIVVGTSFGWVNKIGVRAVSVVTRDGKEHLIPNELLMTQEVENWSYTDRNVRVRIPVGVAYESDQRLAQQLMLQVAADSPRVLDTPRANVWLTAYGAYAIEYDILVWISDPESGVGNVRSDVLNRLWWLFKDHGIVVPIQRQDVFLPQRP